MADQLWLMTRIREEEDQQHSWKNINAVIPDIVFKLIIISLSPSLCTQQLEQELKIIFGTIITHTMPAVLVKGPVMQNSPLLP